MDHLSLGREHGGTSKALDLLHLHLLHRANHYGTGISVNLLVRGMLRLKCQKDRLWGLEDVPPNFLMLLELKIYKLLRQNILEAFHPFCFPTRGMLLFVLALTFAQQLLQVLVPQKYTREILEHQLENKQMRVVHARVVVLVDYNMKRSAAHARVVALVDYNTKRNAAQSLAQEFHQQGLFLGVGRPKTYYMR